MYINKQIEYKNTGHINECWVCNFKTVDLRNLPQISVELDGYKSLEDKELGKEVSDVRLVTVTSADLELNGSIGYGDIPKLYEVITTKTIEETYNEDTVAIEDGVHNGIPYQAGSMISVEKTRTIPAYPDFYQGEIVV